MDSVLPAAPTVLLTNGCHSLNGLFSSAPFPSAEFMTGAANNRFVLLKELFWGSFQLSWPLLSPLYTALKEATSALLKVVSLSSAYTTSLPALSFPALNRVPAGNAALETVFASSAIRRTLLGIAPFGCNFKTTL